MERIVVGLSNERLITTSGLTLVGEAFGKSDLVKQCNRMDVDKKRSQPQIENGDILLTGYNVTFFAKFTLKAKEHMQLLGYEL